MTKREKFWIFILYFLMQRDGVDKMFHLQNKTLVNGVQNMSKKIVNHLVL